MAGLLGPLLKSDENTDFLGVDLRDSMLGCLTGGAL